MKLTEILKETRRYRKAVYLKEAGFLSKVKEFGKRVLKALTPTEMRPAKPEELQRGKEYRIDHGEPGGSYATGFEKLKSKFLANATYEGKKGYHLFRITDLYKDHEPGGGNAPADGKVIQFDDAEVEKFVQTPKEEEPKKEGLRARKVNR